MTDAPADRPTTPAARPHRVGRDWPFYLGLGILGGAYVVLLLAMLVADMRYVTGSDLVDALRKPAIRASIRLSLISCTLTALFSLWVAIPIGYILSRWNDTAFAEALRGRVLSVNQWRAVSKLVRNAIDAILDIPIVLPPLVVGLSLLILFQFPPFSGVADLVVYQVPAVILAQFMVACAFAVGTMRATFDQIDPRREQVALSLGCTRAQAFSRITLPEAHRGIITAATLAWARALGEFGPLLIFAGATRHKTEVLSTTVFLELSIGDLEAAVAVSLIMIASAVVVLIITRLWGSKQFSI